ncbi:MAG: putative phosphoribosyl transferase [Streptosporangiaceae bacterium]|jgi:putative phosphoribosyl transferase|nr:putative phosphoribosyl transferase [Streptosporangiaceae bacterium]
MPFLDRADAGRRLAGKLMRLRGAGIVVLGLPRGGIPVAFEVAQALDAVLDVIVVRKVGLPIQPELAMGAIGEDGVRIVNQYVVIGERVTESEFIRVEKSERAELERRARRFRGDRPRAPLAGRTAVIVDDGIATGSTARAACQVARAHGAARVVLAVPVAPRAAIPGLSSVADEVVCLETPDRFMAIGQWYGDFSQTTDEEVVRLLRRAAMPGPAAPVNTAATPTAKSAPGTPDTAGPGTVGPGTAGPGTAGPGTVGTDEDVEVIAGSARLAGHLSVPPAAAGIVVFAHGSGSSRHSPRNQIVAAALGQAGFGTLLFDLLTNDEERDRSTVFDIGLLAGRLADATRWLRVQPAAGHASIGYFGASTGAAGALYAAAEPGSDVDAIVSRGGRPDLAGPRLASVRAPTLLIVGGQDDLVLGLNQQAQAQLRGESQLAIVPGASHLFEEPGALEQVATLASGWFASHLAPRRSALSSRPQSGA